MNGPPRDIEARVKDILDDFVRGPSVKVTEGIPDRLAPVPNTFRPSPVVALDIPVKIMGAIIGVLVPLTIGAYASGDLETGTAISFGGVLVLVNLIPAALAAAVPSLQVLFTTYHVDKDGIRTETRLFSKSHKAVRWEKVTALVERQTLFDRVFGLRRLRIIAYGERGANLQLVGLRGAAGLRNLVAREMKDAASVERLFGND